MQPRYSTAQQIVHWATAALMLSILPVAWVAMSLKEDSPLFYFWLDVHKSLGLTVLAITLFRVVWRLFDPPPAHLHKLEPWDHWTAQTVYAALLAAMIIMPISGYLWTTGHGYEVDPFGIIHFPKVAFKNRQVGDAAAAIHQWGQWFVYALVGLHLLGVSFHLILRRDGVLGRMLPPHATEPDPNIGK